MSQALSALVAALVVLLVLPAPVPLGPPTTVLPSRFRRAGPAGVVGAVSLGCWLVLDLHDLLLVGLVLASALAIWRLLQRRRAAAAADRRADRVLAVCDTMAADLGAGQPPLRSLEQVSKDWPELAPVASAARMGADVPDLLRELADLPGARSLRTVAATWQVASDSGSGLAAALAQAADGLRAERRTARLVAAELAAAHATARLLAVLPLGVVLLGMGVGADPVGFLLGTMPGLAVLATGLGLTFTGLAWLDRIADGVLGR